MQQPINHKFVMFMPKKIPKGFGQPFFLTLNPFFLTLFFFLTLIFFLDPATLFFDPTPFFLTLLPSFLTLPGKIEEKGILASHYIPSPSASPLQSGPLSHLVVLSHIEKYLVASIV